MGVCTKERKGVTAAVLMATPCTNSLGGESGGQKHEVVYLPSLPQFPILKTKTSPSPSLTSGHEYRGCYALPLLRTNARILRLPLEL